MTNSLSGRYPAFSMSASHLAGSLTSLTDLPLPPARTCALFLLGSPQTRIRIPLRAMDGVVLISSHPGALGYQGGNFPFAARGPLSSLWSSLSKEPNILPYDPYTFEKVHSYVGFLAVS